MAIRLKAKVVPVTIVGNEEIFPTLFGIKGFKKILGSNIAIPLSFFPLPISRIKGRMYPAIDFSGYDPSLADDQAFCIKMAEKLRRQHQRRLNKDAGDQPLYKLNKFIGKIKKAW